jgi:hypothetical protein
MNGFVYVFYCIGISAVVSVLINLIIDAIRVAKGIR